MRTREELSDDIRRLVALIVSGDYGINEMAELQHAIDARAKSMQRRIKQLDNSFHLWNGRGGRCQ